MFDNTRREEPVIYMEEKKKPFSLFVFVAIVIIFLLSQLNMLRRPSDVIRLNILKLTPIGSSMDDVLAIIDEKKWRLRYVNYNDKRHSRFKSDFADKDTKDHQSIEVCLGSYNTILDTGVYAFWDFDAYGKLLEVIVWKDTDVL